MSQFKKLGLSPRDNQLSIINDILTAFYKEDYKNVILNAATGTGKSVIGLIVSMCCVEGSSNQRAWILMHQNQLMRNYFDMVDQHDDFLALKGASNYSCDVLKDDFDGVTAESCIYDALNKAESKDVAICEFCDYKNTRRRMHYTKYLVSNYSYFLIQMLYVRPARDTYELHKAAINVFDESHLINEVFSSHMSVFMSPKRFQTLLDDLHLINSHHAGHLAHWILDWNNVDESNYMSFFKEVGDAYLVLSKHYEELAKKHMNKKQYSDYLLANKTSKKYADFHCKIDDLFKYQFEHIFDKSEQNEITIKPIFVKDLISEIMFADKNLFMSATNSQYMLEQQLNLNPKTTKFINIPSHFPVENKKVYFLDIAEMNYNNMKDPKIVKSILENVVKVIKFQHSKNESGVIITPSFKINELIANEIKKYVPKQCVFEHQSGTKAEVTVNSFKKSKGFSVLISPSIWEGVSLDDDLSRWQIIVKAPYGSLGDKRVSYIAKKFPKIYRLETLIKIIQGIGRSVRSKEDYATTYMIDTHLTQLFNSPMNVWAEQYEAYYKS